MFVELKAKSVDLPVAANKIQATVQSLEFKNGPGKALEVSF